MKNWANLLSYLMAALFLYAGFSKLFAVDAFGGNVRAFRLLPEFFVPTISLSVPLIEILSGIGVFIPRFRRRSFLSLFLLALVFASVLVSALARGLNVECGCFGAMLSGGLGVALARDTGLLVVLGFLYYEALKTPADPTLRQT